MAKQRSWYFWFIFWLVAFIFLVVWFLFWRYQHQGKIGLLKTVVNILPMESEKKGELNTVLEIAEKISQGEEKTFLVLFQNSDELRPGGGYIGSFGIIKIKGERITAVDTHDTNIFDSAKVTGVEPPYPMGKMLNITDWEMRDSNWSADFPTNALKAIEFYQAQGGKEKFDGVFAVSSKILPVIFEVIGPIEVPGYSGEFNKENAIEKLQYQVEKGYYEQTPWEEVDRGKRKYIMKDLAKIIAQKIQMLSWSEKKALAQKIEQQLKRKNIMLYFKDNVLEEKVIQMGWDGKVEKTTGDYLMLVDANLGSLKTDALIKRSFEYQVDFRHPKPWAKLKLNYENQGKKEDWKMRDYNVFTRILVPKDSWLYELKNASKAQFDHDSDKKTIGFIQKIDLGQKKTVEINYDLPETIKEYNYSLLIQKQSGVDDLSGKVKLIFSNGEEEEFEIKTVNKIKLENIAVPASKQVIIK